MWRDRLRVRGGYLQPLPPAVAAAATALQHDVRAICVDCESVQTSRAVPERVYKYICMLLQARSFAKAYGHTYTTPYSTRSARLPLSYLHKPAALVLGEGGKQQRRRRERGRMRSGAEGGESDSK